MNIIMSCTKPRRGSPVTMDDNVIRRPSSSSRRSLTSAKSFDRQYINNINPSTSPPSIRCTRRSELSKSSGDGLNRGRLSNLTRRNIFMRSQQVMTSSSFDTEGEPSSHPQSYRIKSRRGAVTSDLSPVSSEASVEDSHDHQDAVPKVTPDLVTVSAPCSPQMNIRTGGSSLDKTCIASSDPGPTLASVAAVHFQDFIEASAQGLNKDSAFEQETKKKFGAVLRKSISAKIRKKLRRQESFTAENITSLISDFKLHDKDELEFAIYKDKHWRDFMEWSLGRPEPINHESVNKDEIKRRDKVWELFRSECVYLVDHILVLKEIFQERLRWLQCEGHLMHIEVAKLFANVDELSTVSTEFCRELFRNFVCGDGSTEFGGTKAVIAAFENFSNLVCPAYSRYCMNYAGALQYLQTLKRQDEFLEFSKLCEQDKRCKRLKLADLLITPIQRITKYSLLLRDIRECTKDVEEQDELESTLQNVDSSLDDLEGMVKWLSSFERLREIQQMLTWPADKESMDISKCRCLNDDESSENNSLMSSQRTLVHEGPLRMIENGKTLDVYAFLFDDMLLVTKKRRKLVTRRSFTGYPSHTGSHDQVYTSLPRHKDGIFFVVSQPPIMLEQLLVTGLGESTEADIQHTMELLKLSRNGSISDAFTFDCSTDNIKRTWVSHLQKSKRKWTETILKGIVATDRWIHTTDEDRRKTY